jgi:hypothetical protein
MVKFADSSILIWLIIFVMVSLAKGWSKLQESKESQSPESDDTPPPVPPKTPVRRPQLRPPARPMPRVPRAVPPAMRRPMQQPRPITVPTARNVSADDIRRVVDQMSRKPPPLAPAPPPLSSPPVATAEIFPPPPPTPPPAPSPSLQEAAAPVPTPVSAPAPAQPSRASQWMEALRDRQNIRNIIIAYEIIGPPRSQLI